MVDADDLDPQEMDADRLFRWYIGGESRAFDEIWRRHHRRMRAIVQGYLRPYRELSRGFEVDEFVNDVIGKLTEQIPQGEPPAAGECDRFWMLFRTVARQCILEKLRWLSAIKRGGNGVHKTGDDGRRPAVLSRSWATAELDDLARIESRDLGPEVVAIMDDVLRRFYELLDEEQAIVLTHRLALHDIPEIATKMGLSERTISRRLNEIRRVWERHRLLD
jgi:RNA polymerase sigma factor (sigma-70 family)